MLCLVCVGSINTEGVISTTLALPKIHVANVLATLSASIFENVHQFHRLVDNNVAAYLMQSKIILFLTKCTFALGIYV